MKLSEVLNSDYGININFVIYKIINTTNGKIYIGQTSISLRKRLIKHLSDAKITTKTPKHFLQKAIIKYGYENFIIEIVETCKNKQELNEREIYWINHYNSTNPNLGYNCTYGGQGNKNVCEISKESRLKISQNAKEHWSNPEYKLKQQISRKRSYLRKQIQIVQLDLSFNYIKTWDSKKEVSKEFNSNIYNLRKDVKHLRIGNNIFMTLENYNDLKLPDPVILQLDEYYNIVNEFYSYQDANLKIKQLIGSYGHLQFTAIQPRTSKCGTKKAGYIWMTYENYIKYKSK